MTQIVFGNFVFSDASREIISATGALSQSLIGDKLAADEFNFVVSYDPAALGYYIQDSTEGSGFFYTADDEVYCVKGSQQDIDDNLAPFMADFVKDTPVDIYNDGTKLGRFYVQKVYPLRINQDGSVWLQFNALSLIGLTVHMTHAGGMYTNAKAGDVIAEILSATYNASQSTATVLWYDLTTELHYTIDAAVANTRVDGHLPMTGRGRSARDNLRDVLLVTGASVLKDTEGSVRFTFNQPSEPINIATTDIYRGDAYADDDSADVTVVKVIQNSYTEFEGTEVVEFETAEVVDHQKILFDEPVFRVWSSQAAGEDTLTIHEWGVNYAIVSGTGTLYGMPYLNTQIEYSEQIREGVEASRTAECGLISLLNYKNVLDRMVNWYSNRQTVSSGIVMDGSASTGSLVSFLDPLNREKTGYIEKLTYYLSGIIKADTQIVTDWHPTGTGNNFTTSQTLTGSGTWSKAAAAALVGHDINLVRFDIVGGGDGGQPGENGTPGAGMDQSAFDPQYVSGKGIGGDGGEGGLPGRVYSITLEGDDIPDFITFSCGDGGQPGSNGTDSSITVSGTTYSSSSGVRPAAGYMDLFTGIVRALKGPAGIKGGDGGDDISGEGESVTYKGRTWTAGQYPGTDSVSRYEYTKNSSGQLVNTGRLIHVYSFGTVSGGAAFGRNSPTGVAGSLGTIYRNGSAIVGVASAISKPGIAGANALPIDDYTPELGSGGAGGNGGGGGGSSLMGQGSGGWRWANNQWEAVPANNGAGARGPGGTGSEGTAGGAGFVNVYI